MLTNFTTYCQSEKIVPYQGTMLLAVSGGKDSVCMAHLFKEAGLNFAIAHCNFQLRGDASDGDQEFVKALASDLDVPFYTTFFDTKNYASERGISTQMAARDLRYGYFQDLIDEHKFVGVATAHHMDDVVETMLLNLTRGTGLAGLHGILPVRGNVYRPLLFTNSDDILVYLSSNGIKWREDQSNSEIKYKRNLLRHKVLPVLEELNPSFRKSFSGTASKVRLYKQYLNDSLIELSEQFIIPNVHQISVDLAGLRGHDHAIIILETIISEYGFTHADARSIIESDHQSGKKYQNSTHELLIDRDQLHVRVRSFVEKSDSVHISGVGSYGWMGGTIEVERVEMSISDVTPSCNIAYLDARKVEFPLTIRLWQDGDVFQPLGMKGKKKLSDFLIDEKVAMIDKEKVGVVVAKNDIVWVINHRIDDSYKLTDTTNEVIKLIWSE